MANARRTDPISSHLTADINQAERATIMHRLIAACGKYPGSTYSELSLRTGIERHSAWKRLNDAFKKGYVIKSGFRECTLSGKTVTTWQCTDKPLPTE